MKVATEQDGGSRDAHQRRCNQDGGAHLYQHTPSCCCRLPPHQTVCQAQAEPQQSRAQTWPFDLLGSLLEWLYHEDCISFLKWYGEDACSVQCMNGCMPTYWGPDDALPVALQTARHRTLLQPAYPSKHAVRSQAIKQYIYICNSSDMFRKSELPAVKSASLGYPCCIRCKGVLHLCEVECAGREGTKGDETKRLPEAPVAQPA